MTSSGTWSPIAVEGRAVGGAAEFPALTRLTRVLLVTGVLCLCGAVLALTTSQDPFSERASLITSLGVVLCGAGLIGTASRWPPGAAGRRSPAVLVVAVLMGLAGLVAAALQLPSGSSAAFAIGYPAVNGLLGQLVLAGLLRSLLWRSAAMHRREPGLPRAAWWPCVGLGLGSLLLPAVTWVVAGPTEGPASARPVAIAAAQTVRRVAEVGLGSALLAAVLLCWLHGRTPRVHSAAPREGEPMEDGATQQSWDAVAPPPPMRDGLAGRLVALGLGALALSGVLWAALYGLNDLSASGDELVFSVLFVGSALVSVAGSAMLTAGLVGLVLDRALRRSAPVPAPLEPPVPPSSPEPEAVEPPQESDGDARWRR